MMSRSKKNNKVENEAKQSAIASSASTDSKTASDMLSAAAARKGKIKLAGVGIASFLAAFFLAWLLFSSVNKNSQPQTEQEPPPVPTKTLTEAEVTKFLEAVEAKNYPAMEAIGKELFKKGDSFPDQEQLLSGYEVSSFPPYQVYAFYTTNNNEFVYRVLLTMDENHKVESFMAEEMPVVK